MLNDLLVFVISISVLCCCCTCGRGSYSRRAALPVIILLHNALPNGVHVQGSAIGWALGCVNPASWLPLAMGASSRNLGSTFYTIPAISAKSHLPRQNHSESRQPNHEQMGHPFALLVEQRLTEVCMYTIYRLV